MCDIWLANGGPSDEQTDTLVARMFCTFFSTSVCFRMSGVRLACRMMSLHVLFGGSISLFCAARHAQQGSSVIVYGPEMHPDSPRDSR